MEFRGFPESLTKDHQMYHGNKSIALESFDLTPSSFPTIQPVATVIDFSASISRAKIFEDFSVEIIKCIERISVNCSRVDIVCDNSLKAHTRDCRGVGQYFPFSATTSIPKDFVNNFLNNNRNKMELNLFLTEQLINHNFGNVLLFVSLNHNIRCNNCNPGTPITDLQKGSEQEEADTKIIVHVLNCIPTGFKNVMIKTVDTDVVTLLLAYFPEFELPNEIEVDLGFGKYRRYYNINKISSQITNEQRSGLLFFYMFTGCDITSAFYSISKAAWWKTCCKNPFITRIFRKLSWTPHQVNDEDFQYLERFVCSAYDIQCRFNTDDINKLRYLLFLKLCENNLRRLPPTRDALRQHIFRAAYAAGWIWGKTLKHDNQVTSPTEWGWRFNNDRQLVPNWCPSVLVELKGLFLLAVVKEHVLDVNA